VRPTVPEALGLMTADVDRYWLALNERQPVTAG
jgi:hypothetical protein